MYFINNFLKLTCSIILITVQLSFGQKTKPNVIFIFSDDQRFNSLSMTGDPITQTPHIDQLAKEGVFFNNAYITSPICGPSRANIFTGQWERKNKIGFNYISKNIISKETYQNSWLAQLKKAGYSTAFIGKSHTKIADRKNTPLNENTDFAYYGEGHLGFYPAKKHKQFSNLKNETQIEGLLEATKAYLTQDNSYDYFYKNALPSIQNQLKKRDPKKPFSTWINLNLPHASSIGGMGSRTTDPEYYKTLYNDVKNKIDLPTGYPQDISLPDNVYATKDLMKYYVTSNKNKLLNEKLKMDRAIYAIDLMVGNLRTYLKEIGEDKNTIIIFCSDNGLFLGEHGLGGKTILYDESVHVPLIVYSPYFDKKTKGKTVSEMVVGQDIPATILQMCGIDIPKTYQGKSLLPLIENKKYNWRNEIFLENLFTDQGYPRQEGVRSKQYKYIRSFSKTNDRKKYLPHQTFKTKEAPIYEELFDIVKDPKEQNNLVTNPAYKKELEYYRDRCTTLVEELY
ncbi:sulfatase-like hydrolase/transferase [Wenyingzhuangia sp. 2_MG-2023]|uniref:sulfatase-like hydrolase/transferase n=1 Tax=Wenyingzhuangia sp. 2_MG-2023 TaxID=3062639 RepID=UPI0026E430D9|nr:sulfatase-like hydrolase/transferase [Wenyingzhuangia sp. 2_MG-2023]MDO6736311.1 sulfatase-like hydrolase/transferase [Wenyingzhuangia sp. 2_MG-2023]